MRLACGAVSSLTFRAALVAALFLLLSSCAGGTPSLLRLEPVEYKPKPETPAKERA